MMDPYNTELISYEQRAAVRRQIRKGKLESQPSIVRANVFSILCVYWCMLICLCRVIVEFTELINILNW